MREKRMMVIGADLMAYGLAMAALERRARSAQGVVLDDVTPAANTETPEPTVTRQQRRHAERQARKGKRK